MVSIYTCLTIFNPGGNVCTNIRPCISEWSVLLLMLRHSSKTLKKASSNLSAIRVFHGPKLILSAQPDVLMIQLNRIKLHPFHNSTITLSNILGHHFTCSHPSLCHVICWFFEQPPVFVFGNQNWHGFVPSPTVTGIKSGLYNCVWSAWEAQQNYQWLSVKRTCEKKTYTLWHWGSDKGSQGWWRNIFYYLGPQVPMKVLNLQYMGKNHP